MKGKWNPLAHLSLRARLLLLALLGGAGGAALVEMALRGTGRSELWLLLAAATLLACCAAEWLAREFGSRLRAAAESARRIAAGAHDEAIDISRDDDIGDLLLALRSMQARIAMDAGDSARIVVDRARLRKALDAAATAILLTDGQLDIVYINPTLQRIFARAEGSLRKDIEGFSAGALLGSKLDGFFHDVPDRERMFVALQDTQLREVQLGGLIFNVLLTPIDDADGERVGYVAEWRDRTDAVAFEAEINAVVSAAAEGDFSRRIQLQKSGSNKFFMDLVDGFNRVLDINKQALENIVVVLDALADGDLTRAFDGSYRGTLAKVQENVNSTVQRLNAIAGRIKVSAGTIGGAAAAIAAGNAALSARTEREADNLQQTTVNLERLMMTVKQNAEHARQARQLVGSSMEVAQRGGTAVDDVVATMTSIHQLSQKIADITGVIDGIAFQTNILALNSAVEAARAGEHGRGFAVVAGEVRSLAQRAAAAAKEIKQLTGTSVDQIDNGSRLVGVAGETMREIIRSIQKVTQIMGDIAAASQEQSAGVEQVNAAVMQTDQATRDNTRMVEKVSASARSLEHEVAVLGETVAVFRTTAEESPSPTAAPAVAPTAAPMPADTRRAAAKPASATRSLPRAAPKSAR